MEKATPTNIHLSLWRSQTRAAKIHSSWEKKVKVKKPAATVVERAVTEADDDDDDEEEQGLITKITAISMHKLSEGKWLQDQFRQECVEQGDQVRVLMCPLACRVQVESSTGETESDNSLAPLGQCAFSSQNRFFYLFAIRLPPSLLFPIFPVLGRRRTARSHDNHIERDLQAQERASTISNKK
jgi:hypothetical protein